MPYYSLDDVYDQITREDIVVDYIVQCENVFKKFGITHTHVDDYPECLKEFIGRKIWKDTINSISSIAYLSISVIYFYADRVYLPHLLRE